jgi:hypothetical protein
VHVGYLFRWWSDLILLCHLCLRVDMILLATTRQSCMCFGSWPGLMISPMHASLGSSSSLSFSYHGCIRWLREWSKYTENNVSLDVGGTGIDGKRSNFQIFFFICSFPGSRLDSVQVQRAQARSSTVNMCSFNLDCRVPCRCRVHPQARWWRHHHACKANPD